MKKEIVEALYSKLPYLSDLIIEGKHKPIEMDLFLSFLTIEVSKKSILASWTERVNKNHKLIINGYLHKSNTECLESIEFGEHLNNPWNNDVNPFYLFDIMTKEGQRFFLDYYKEDIESVVRSKVEDIDRLKHELTEEMKSMDLIQEELRRSESDSEYCDCCGQEYEPPAPQCCIACNNYTTHPIKPDEKDRE